MSISNYLEAKILDHVLRNTAYTPASTIYLALHTTDPGEIHPGLHGHDIAEEHATTGGAHRHRAIGRNSQIP